MELVQLTEDQFDEMFTPQQNHLDENASFSGCLFETYGKELAYVMSLANTNRVVTILDLDGDTYFVSGFHFVNRLGYLILDKPYEFEFEAKLDW